MDWRFVGPMPPAFPMEKSLLNSAEMRQSSTKEKYMKNVFIHTEIIEPLSMSLTGHMGYALRKFLSFINVCKNCKRIMCTRNCSTPPKKGKMFIM